MRKWEASLPGDVMGVELLLLRQRFEVWLDDQWHHRWWRVGVEL